MRLLISERTLHLTYLLMLLCYIFSLPAYSQSTNQSSSHSSEQREYVQMSLEHFAEVAQLTHQDHQSAQWSHSKINIQFSSTHPQQGWVEITANVHGKKSDWIYLAPRHIYPIQVWLDHKSITPKTHGGFYAVDLADNKKIKIRYPFQITGQDEMDRNALIPFPPISSADLKIEGLHNAFTTLPHYDWKVDHSMAEAALQGALAISIQHMKQAYVLQKQNIQVGLHESGQGADIKIMLKTLVQKAGTWVNVAPKSDALIHAQLNQHEAIVDVKGHWYRVWVEQVGTHKIDVSLRTRIDRKSGQPKIKLSPQSVPVSHVEVRLPGQREVEFDPAVPLLTKILKSSSIDQNATVQSPNSSSKKASSLTVVSADLPPLDHVLMQWSEKRDTPEESSAQYLTETYQLFNVQEGLLKGVAHSEIDIIKGEIQSLSVQIPDEVVLYHVSGAGVEDWMTLPAQQEGDRMLKRRVKITFGQAQSGKITLQLKWQKVVQLSENFTLPLIVPLGAFQQSGMIALYDGDRVGFTPAKLAGNLTAIGQESIPSHILQLRAGEKVSQAVRHIQAPHALSTSITTERARELRFDANIDTLYSLKEGVAQIQSQMLLNLKSGRLERLVLSLPKDCSEPQISGPSINKVEPIAADHKEIQLHLNDDQRKNKIDPKVQHYLISFTRRLEGTLSLNVDSEILMSNNAQQLKLPRLSVLGAELTRGQLGISVEDELEVHAQQEKGLKNITVEQLPRSIRLRNTQELVLGYQFTRSWMMDLSLKRHKVVETLSANINKLHIQTHLLASGQRVDWVTYYVDNQDVRTMKITPPAGATVRTVKVNQSDVKARDEAGSIRVSIPKRQASTVEIRYEMPQKSIEKFTKINLQAPHSDIRSTGIEWRIFYLPKWQLWSHKGELRVLEEHSYAKMWNPSSFRALKRMSSFQYDLLNPQQKALEITLSMSPRVSIETIMYLYLGSLICLFIYMLGLLIGKRWKPVLIGTGLLFTTFILLSIYSQTRNLMEQVAGFIGFAFFLFIVMHGFRFIRRVWNKSKIISKDQVHQKRTDSEVPPYESLNDDGFQGDYVTNQDHTENDHQIK
jgi:hypothetical protein